MKKASHEAFFFMAIFESIQIMRFISIFLFIISYSVSQAQIVALPDSAVVRKNKVKSVRIYLDEPGGKTVQKIVQYDKRGRIVMERLNEESPYSTYSYDSTGRVRTFTSRSRTGEYIYKTVTHYQDKDSLRTVYEYFDKDSTKVTRVCTYNKRGNKIKETGDNGYGKSYVSAWIYNDEGRLIAEYDSSSSSRTASWRSNFHLVKRRTYDPSGTLLHEYNFSYHPNGQIATISDSTGTLKTVHYEIRLDKDGEIAEYWRDQTKMAQPEISTFREEYYFIFPEHEQSVETEEGFKVENEHHFTYDKKGKIVRDDLVQKWGASSSTYVYVYEYEFY
jgi:hypothetical protein